MTKKQYVLLGLKQLRAMKRPEQIKHLKQMDDAAEVSEETCKAYRDDLIPKRILRATKESNLVG